MSQKFVAFTLVVLLVIASIGFAFADTSHVVKKGDVLWKIAKEHNTTYQELAKYNKIADPNMIFPNQVIKIPDKKMAEQSGTAKATSAADTVIIGNVYTADKNNSMAQALAIKDGRYTYVGDENGVKPNIGSSTEVIRLDGGMAMPSFTDGHAHGHEGGVAFLFQADLYGLESIDEYLGAVGKFIAEHPDMKFIRGQGWRNGYFPEGGPTAAMLDKVDTDLPIMLISEDHHSYWLNSKALEMLGPVANIKDVEGGVVERDKNGNPTGTFRELARVYVDDILPMYTVEQYKEAILFYQEWMLEYGITAYWEPMVNLDGGVNLVKAYNELEKEGKLLTRVYGGYMILDEPGFLDEIDLARDLIKSTAGGDFEIDAIKILVDGVVEGGTAYLLSDYANQPGFRSSPLWTQERLNLLFAKADALGITVHTHAIGDAATKMTVDACEYAFKKNGDMGNRHAITHLQVVDPADIKRMAELNMVASVNTYWFAKEPGYFYELEVPFLGEERANKQYPLKSFFDLGIVAAGASDFPVTVPPRPLWGIQTGVTRMNQEGLESTLQNPAERATIEQMISAYTINGAYQLFKEKEFGSIEVGKSADLIILDQNLLRINPVRIGETKILRSFLKGNTIFEAE
ncbi:amidohydrolase [Bacillota bacterium]